MKKKVKLNKPTTKEKAFDRFQEQTAKFLESHGWVPWIIGKAYITGTPGKAKLNFNLVVEFSGIPKEKL